MRLLAVIFTSLLLAHNLHIGTEALAPFEICENCQKVVFYAFQYYRYTTTKRLLRHRIKHLCNRYFEYRRHCLVLLVHKVEDIWSDMERALDDGESHQFKPFKTCEKLKECEKDHSPIRLLPREINGTALLEANQRRPTTEKPEEEDAITPDYIF